MARKSAKKTRSRRHELSQELSELIKREADRCTKDFRPEHFSWIGSDGTLSREEVNLFEKELDGPDSALATIIRRVILNHPVVGEDDAERLHIAMHALLGSKRANKLGFRRGRKKLGRDRAVLKVIALEYFLDPNHSLPITRNFAQLYRAIAKTVEPEMLARDKIQVEHRIRHLRTKFKKDNDRIMLAYAPQDIYSAQRQAHLVSSALNALEELGLTGKRD